MAATHHRYLQRQPPDALSNQYRQLQWLGGREIPSVPTTPTEGRDTHISPDNTNCGARHTVGTNDANCRAHYQISTDNTNCRARHTVGTNDANCRAHYQISTDNTNCGARHTIGTNDANCRAHYQISTDNTKLRDESHHRCRQRPQPGALSNQYRQHQLRRDTPSVPTTPTAGLNIPSVPTTPTAPLELIPITKVQSVNDVRRAAFLAVLRFIVSSFPLQ